MPEHHSIKIAASWGDEGATGTAERIAGTISHHITTEALSPGSHLRQEALEAELNIARWQAVAGLERLEQLGVVIRRPRRGYIVA